MVFGTTISHCHKVGQDLSDALVAAMAAVRAFAMAEALEARTEQRLAIIVEELVINLLEHAMHERDIAFTLAFGRDGPGSLVTLEDDSDPFDPRSVPMAEAPNPIRGGGVGLALVNAWSDILSYDSGSGRNRLTLLLRGPAD